MRMRSEAERDEALVNQSRAGDKSALDILLHRYKPMVKAKAKPYYLASGDPEDLIQEGMIGLYKAVLDFAPEKNQNFGAFASLCIVRQIQTAIKAAARQKHIPLNTSLSLDSEVKHSAYQNGETGEAAETYLDKLPDRRVTDPEALFLGRETLKDIDDFIRRGLSRLEYSVLMLHMDGKSHAEIAQTLNKSVKSVDNSLQRVRRKVKKLFP